MYGVPSTLDLSPFRGRTLIQIALGEWQVQFHFHPKGSIHVEGRWELLDEQAQVLDRSLEPNQRSEYRLNRILGKVVAATQVNPPGSISLTFENGCVLRVSDDDPRYEAFTVHPGNGEMVII